MSYQWADFPSGQRGLYGTNANAMLNGTPWVQMQGSLIADPDPTFPNGIVMAHGASSNGPTDASRIALPTPHQLVGLAHRLYLVSLPSIERSYVTFNTSGNAVNYTYRLAPNGSILIYRGATLIADSLVPVVFANSWNHLEYLVDCVTGDIETRLNGTAISALTLTDGAPPGGTTGLVGFPDRNAGNGSSGSTILSKDVVVYNGAGTVFNDFQGSVTVNDLYPSADISMGGWTLSRGIDGYALIKDNVPANRLTVTGAIANGYVVQAGGVYYKFTSGSVNAGAPAGTNVNPWLIALGTTAECMSRLDAAINLTGVAGTDYSTGTTINPYVESVGFSDTAIAIQSKDGVTASYACSVPTGSGAMSWTGATMINGPTDLSYISADNSPPAASEVSFTDLDPDVTSVRAVMSVVRAYKTDGGDGNLQVSLSPDGVNYDDGADRAVTSTPTFFADTSELSPATSAAWLPGEVNTIRAKNNRTV